MGYSEHQVNYLIDTCITAHGGKERNMRHMIPIHNIPCLIRYNVAYVGGSAFSTPRTVLHTRFRPSFLLALYLTPPGRFTWPYMLPCPKRPCHKLH
jgi:hypothetical protein